MTTGVRRENRVHPLAVALAAVGLLLGAGCWREEPEAPAAPPADTPRSATDDAGQLRTPPQLTEYQIGGDFELTDTDGNPWRLSEHRGTVFLMFFGYTSCPDFCPRTLALLGDVFDQLGEDAAGVQTLFVSLDPERDTPDKIRQYLEYFGIPAVGLSGSKEQIDELVPRYAGRYEVQEDDSAAGPLFSHTTYIYLIDPQGNVRYTFMPNDTRQFIAAGVRQLLP